MVSWAEPGPLAERTALVTGASRGIGLAVARLLIEAGARVALVARGEQALARSARDVGGIAIAADVANEESVAQLAGAVRAAFSGDPDVVVNAAGAFELAPLAETTIASFDRQWAVNVRGAFLVIRAFLPAMLARASGHVVTLGSIAGRVAFPANAAYAASKFAVRGLHAVLDVELRGTGVRSSLVEPGATDTPLWESVDRGKQGGLPEPGSMLSAQAVADAVLFAVTRPADVAVRTILIERA